MLGLNRADSASTVVDSAVRRQERRRCRSVCTSRGGRPSGPPTPPMASQATTTTQRPDDAADAGAAVAACSRSVGFAARAWSRARHRSTGSWVRSGVAVSLAVGADAPGVGFPHASSSTSASPPTSSTTSRPGTASGTSTRRWSPASEPDTVLLLEHAAVYTAGKRTEPHERPFDGTPVIDVDRGGKITWHGPGQLVGYPIVRLPDPIDVVAHVRRLEEMMIRRLRRPRPGRRPRRGPQRRLGGRRRRRARTARSARSASGSAASVTMHGFALNCDCDLSWARGHRPLRHRRRRRDVAEPASSAAT